MAEQKAEAAAADAPKKSNKLFLIIGMAAALLLGGAGAAAYLMLGKKAQAAGATANVAKKTPVFVDLDSFTVNLSGDENDRFMQVKLVAEVKDDAAGETLKSLMPAVRNEILLLLGSKRAADVATREGKEKLAGEIVVAVNKPLEGTPAAKAVEGVNFTHLIVQ